MNINFGGDNSISNLSFIWTAKFKDSEDICQFDFETGKENRFKLVQDKFDKLEYFLLWNKDKVFTVDLINGLIYFNTELKDKQNSTEKKNIRLIFFRRHKVEIGTEDLIAKNHEILYFLGFQYQDEKNNNHKIILEIDKQGNFIIKD